MHKKLYIVLILVDALVIAGMFLLNHTWFLSVYDISGFAVFCGTQLAMCAFWLVKGDLYGKRRGIVLIVSLVLCIGAYVLLLPRYTVLSAEQKVQSDARFSNFKVSPNAQIPTMGAEPSPGLLVKNCYCFVAVSAEKTYDIRFNPVGGNFDVLAHRTIE